MSEKTKMLSGELYNANDRELVKERHGDEAPAILHGLC